MTVLFELQYPYESLSRIFNNLTKPSSNLENNTQDGRMVGQTKAAVSALRAISALLLKRLLKPAEFMIIILIFAGYALTIMLTLSFSKWWLLLLLIFIPVTLMFLALVVVIKYLIVKLLPRKLSRNEREQVSEFTEKVFSVAERTRTPYPLLLFLIAKDVIRGKESSFLSRLIGDSKGLLTDFENIRTLFKS